MVARAGTIAFILGLLAAPAIASLPLTPLSASAQPATMDAAITLLHDGKPDEAVDVLDRVIAAHDRSLNADTRRPYAARTPDEGKRYLAQAQARGETAVLVDASMAQALFLKGFALIDLGQADAAKPFLDRAVALSPMNAQYLAEAAEWHKARGEWDAALAGFEQARAAAAVSPEDARAREQARAERGIGFVLIEKGRLDEAEAMFRGVLDRNPEDQRAKGELEVIAAQRAGSTS